MNCLGFWELFVLRTVEELRFFGLERDPERLTERLPLCVDMILTYAKLPIFCRDRDRFLPPVALGEASMDVFRNEAFGFFPQASIVLALSTNCI